MTDGLTAAEQEAAWRYHETRDRPFVDLRFGFIAGAEWATGERIAYLEKLLRDLYAAGEVDGRNALISRAEAAEARVAELEAVLLWAYGQFPSEMHGAVHPVLDRALVAPTTEEVAE